MNRLDHVLIAAAVAAIVSGAAIEFSPSKQIAHTVNVQTVYFTNSTLATVTSSTFTATNFTTTITPTSNVNAVRASADGAGRSNAAATSAVFQMKRATTLIGNQVIIGSSASNVTGAVSLRALDFPSAASSTAYAVYLESSDNSSQVNFSAFSSPAAIQLEEIMGALEPANDRGAG